MMESRQKLGPWGPPLLLLLLLGTRPILAQETPQNLIPLWKLVPPGRLLGLPVPGPEGTWAFLCEDKNFYLVGNEGRIAGQWTSGQRFVDHLSRSNRGEWLFQTRDRVLRILGPDLVLQQEILLPGILSGPPAQDPKGDFLVSLESGEVLGISREGRILWKVPLDEPAAGPPAMDAHGEYWISTRTGRLVCLDPYGVPLVDRRGKGPFPILIFNPQTGLVAAGTSQLSWLDETGEETRNLRVPGEKILQLLSEESGNLWVVATRKILVLDPLGRQLRLLPLSAPPSGPGLLDREGNLILPLEGGKLLRTLAGKPLWEEIYSEGKSLRTLSLSREGTLAVSGEAWTLTALPSSPAPAFGWTQLHGTPEGTSSIFREVAPRNLSRPFEKIPEYQYFKALIERGDYGSQSKALGELEGLAARGELSAKWGYASLLLISLVQSGVTQTTFLNLRLVNNFPDLRRRAMALLSTHPDLKIRKILAATLLREFDPTGVTGGIRLLGRIGWDGDGTTVRTLWELMAESRDEARAQAALEALKNILKENGRLTDPSGLQLLSQLYLGPFSPGLKREAQKVLQALGSGRMPAP